MRLYGNGALLNGIALSVELEKSLEEAAATLTAVLLTGAGDTYLQRAALGTGDPVQLLDDGGREVFRGAVQAIRRTPERVTVTACDQGLYLARNQLSGVFAGTPEQVCRAVAARLGIGAGELDVPGGYCRLVARPGTSAFTLLRRAVGQDREIGIRDGRLTVTSPSRMAYELAPERVLEIHGTADVRELVDRCLAVGRNGAVKASAESQAQIAAYGLRQRIVAASGDAAAQARAGLTGRRMTGGATVWGNLSYCCGSCVTLHRPQWGLDGTWPITAVRHRWAAGLFTTALTWAGTAEGKEER